MTYYLFPVFELTLPEAHNKRDGVICSIPFKHVIIYLADFI